MLILSLVFIDPHPDRSPAINVNVNVPLRLFSKGTNMGRQQAMWPVDANVNFPALIMMHVASKCDYSDRMAANMPVMGLRRLKMRRHACTL